MNALQKKNTKKFILSLTLVLCLLCGYGELKAFGTQENSAILRTPFEMNVGDKVQIKNSIQISVLNIEDSRCPSDVQCIWQGEAKVQINIKEGNSDRGNFVLSTQNEQSQVKLDKILITLKQVNPYPISTKKIEASDYIITLVATDTQKKNTPRSQFLEGISVDKIVCSENLQLIMKKADGKPACVKGEVFKNLLNRGWGVHVLPSVVADQTQNSDIFEMGSLGITTEMKNYNNSTGFIARPSQDGDFPGVILIHEWWGLNDNIKDMAKNLASHGYMAFAVDLYAGQVATTSDDARKLTTTFNENTGTLNLQKAEDLLKSEYGIKKIATIGWCFGGTQSMNYALTDNNIDATVIYYGQLVTDKDQLSKIDWPVMGVFGGLDQSITSDSVNQFKKTLDNLGVENQIIIYPNVGHAFANPTGASYSPEETKDAWHNTVSFLDNHLKR